VERLDAVDDEQRPDRGIRVVGIVRYDVERRLLDRMEGAIAASAPLDRSAAVMAALVIGFDFAVREGFLRILGDPPAEPNMTASPPC
jgi:hypothetical protein